MREKEKKKFEKKLKKIEKKIQLSVGGRAPLTATVTARDRTAGKPKAKTQCWWRVDSNFRHRILPKVVFTPFWIRRHGGGCLLRI